MLNWIIFFSYWLFFFSKEQQHGQIISTRKVCFNEAINVYIYEDPTQTEELKESRKSDFAQREADKARMEKMISSILTQSHRNSIRLLQKKYYEQESQIFDNILPNLQNKKE